MEERTTLRDEIDLSGLDNESVGPMLDLEQEFLDHLTSTEDLAMVIREGFDVDLLNTPNRKAITNFAVHYFKQNGTAPTPEVFLMEFPNIELYETRAAMPFVLEKLRERFQRNGVQTLIRGVAKLSDSPTEALSYLREHTLDIERKSMTSKTVWSADHIDEFITSMKEKILAGQFKGHSFGFKEVDDFTGGNKPGYLAGLAARPKRQKTFYACQAFIANVFRGEPSVFYTLENSQDEIILRISCMLSGIPWDRVQRGECMPADWEAIRHAWHEFKKLAPAYIVRPDVGERSVQSLLLQADKLEVTNVTVSQFKYIEPVKDNYRAEHEKWGSIVVDLKLAATSPGRERPWYIETQLNREAQSMTEMQDADLSQLGLTDMWGQACDIMFCLFQNRDLRASGLTEFGIIEARNSDKNSWIVHGEFKEGTELKIV